MFWEKLQEIKDFFKGKRYFLFLFSLYVLYSNIQIILNLDELSNHRPDEIFKSAYYWLPAIISSLIFCLGYKRKLNAVIILISSQLTYYQIYMVAKNFVGYFFLVYLFNKSSNKEGREDPVWDQGLINITWIIFTLSYSITGIDRFLVEEWQNGTALVTAFEVGFLSPWAYEIRFWDFIPPAILKLGTWFFIFTEILAPLFIFTKKSRYIFSLYFISCHVFILFFFRLEEISIVSLIVHMFLFYNDASFRLDNLAEGIKESFQTYRRKILFFLGAITSLAYIFLGNGEVLHKNFSFFFAPYPAAFNSYDGYVNWNRKLNLKFVYRDKEINKIGNYIGSYKIPLDIRTSHMFQFMFYPGRKNNGDIRPLLCEVSDVTKSLKVNPIDLKKVELSYIDTNKDEEVYKEDIYCE